MLPVFINLLRRLYFMRASRESAAYHSLPKEGIFMDQSRAPIMEALENFKDMRIVPFDVPGHKRGRGSPELTKFLGQQCMTVDVNSMKPLDNLCHPVSVIQEAENIRLGVMTFEDEKMEEQGEWVNNLTVSYECLRLRARIEDNNLPLAQRDPGGGGSGAAGRVR